MKVVATYGMNRTSTEFALVAHLDYVYLPRNAFKSLIDAINHHMEGIMGHSTLMQKFGRVDFCGQLCMKTPKILFGDAMHVKGMGTSI